MKIKRPLNIFYCTGLFMKKTFITAIITLFCLNLETMASETYIQTAISGFSYNDENYLTVIFKNTPSWHTYWKNPGSAGMAPVFNFKINGETLNLTELPWPAPHKFKGASGLHSYGYEGEYAFFFKIPAKITQTILQKKIDLHLKWLACKNTCKQEEKKTIITWGPDKTFVSPENTFLWAEGRLIEKLKELPREKSFPKNLDIKMVISQKTKKEIFLKYTLMEKGPSFPHEKHNLLIPYPANIVSFEEEELFKDKNGNLHGKMKFIWEGDYLEPKVPLPENGRFKGPLKLRFLHYNPLSGQTSIIQKEFLFFSIIHDTPSKTQNGIFVILLFAFLGGLILNLMPCVLPVISLKLFSLIKHREYSQRQIIKHNIFYTLGILFSFFILATIVYLIRFTGHEVGWGFQFQSPTFISLTSIILFVFALNLFGLFELQTPGGRFLGGTKLKDGVLGDFASGIIATILSTPCSAPFLATAVAFAFTSPSNHYIFSVFGVIGLGLAFPFLLTGLFPSFLKFLPRPGMWMNHLKKVMGVALVLTVAWLMDIYHHLEIGKNSLIWMYLSYVAIFLAILFHKKIKLPKIITVVFYLSAVLIIYLNISDHMTPVKVVHGQKHTGTNNIEFTAWSPEKMKSCTDILFIDFTAHWCLTCKLNKVTVLSSNKFKKLVLKHNIKLLRADWTNPDHVIEKWLKEHGKAGVPAYFVRDKQGTLHSLSEILTISELKKTLSSSQDR